MKTKLMIEVQTSDMMICRSSGGLPNPAWLLTTMAYASAVSYQAEQGISPSDRQITMSEVWTSIILYCSHSLSLSLNFKLSYALNKYFIVRCFQQTNKQTSIGARLTDNLLLLIRLVTTWELVTKSLNVNVLSAAQGRHRTTSQLKTIISQQLVNRKITPKVFFRTQYTTVHMMSVLSSMFIRNKPSTSRLNPQHLHYLMACYQTTILWHSLISPSGEDVLQFLSDVWAHF